MDLCDIIANRRMTRNFSPLKIPHEIVMSICKLAMTAPTAGNCRGVEILCISSTHSLETFWNTSTTEQWKTRGAQTGLQMAPVIAIPIYSIEKYIKRYTMDDKVSSALYKKPAEDWDVPFWITDASFAAMTFMLAAQNYGLGTLFFQLHQPQKTVLDSFGVPKEYKTIGAIALGYPYTDRSTTATTNDKIALSLSKKHDARIHIDYW